jgi:hypothetical protein
MLSDQQIRAKYGQPGDLDNFVVIDLPYPMRIAWDTKAVVKRMQCHKLAANPFKAVFSDLLAHYGLSELQRLGIDLFGGCVNVRKMRGSTTRWSRHAWGIAIDLDPARNGLKTKAPIAQFSKPEYKAMTDIFYKHGFIGLGREQNRDYMHFQLE